VRPGSRKSAWRAAFCSAAFACQMFVIKNFGFGN
jgi:hypothetical protein